MPTPAPKSAFDWALVPSFLAVLEAGSLLGAAKRLGMHQPTLSRHVAELEAQLGVPLFERTGRGVTPTTAALGIAEAARAMDEGAVQLSRALARQQENTRGTVRIAASMVAATWLLPKALAELQEREPGIAIELVASNELSNLLRREADIAVRMVRPEQASLIARKLGEVPIVAAAHRGYLSRHGVPKQAADLAHHRLLGRDLEDDILRGVAQMRLPIQREHFALRTDDQVAYGQLVAQGAGIGFVARYAMRQWPGVELVLPGLPIPPLPCWLAVHREIRGNRVVRRVYDFLAEVLPTALAA
jgi:DNA-binding transcriptional LysR family regulator